MDLWFDLGKEFKDLIDYIEDKEKPQVNIKFYYFDKENDEIKFIYLEELQDIGTP